LYDNATFEEVTNSLPLRVRDGSGGRAHGFDQQLQLAFYMRLQLIAAVLALATDLSAASLDLPHYDVEATVDTARNALANSVNIALSAPEVQTVNEFLLGGTFKISQAHAGPDATVEVGLTDKPFPGLQRITVRCKMPRRNGLQIQLRYNGPLASLDTPPLNSITPDRIELSLDSFWLPYEEGFKKFTVKADIRGVPPDLVVVGTGAVRRTNGHVYITRETGDVDLAFVAMRGLQRATSDGFELYAADLSTKASTIYLRHGGAIMKFLETWFGRMPGRPVRVVVVQRKRKSGYNRIGYIVITEGVAQREPELAHFMAHEFAHAWWAPCDPRTEDRWLSESIAEYIAIRYIEATMGSGSREVALSAKRSEAAKAGPLLGAGERGYSELYNKGPILLFDLEASIGRTSMDNLLARLAQHPPRTTAEFMRALSEVAGEESTRKFDEAMRH
jgi:hypothetical protein